MYTGSGIIKIFAGRTGKPFAQRMCDYLGAQMGDATTIMFDDLSKGVVDLLLKKIRSFSYEKNFGNFARSSSIIRNCL